MPKLQYLQWARGVAASLVVFHHITLDFLSFYQYKAFNNFFYFGMAGVDFFFVLSGFIIYYIHSNDNPSVKNIKNYILKRLIRVYPPVLFISSILLISYLIMPNLTARSELFEFTFLVKSFLLLPQKYAPLLTVSWTLVHEMFFYTLFIALIFNKKIGLFIFMFWSLSILLFNIFTKQLSFPYSFYFNLHNLEFLFGILVAYLFKNNHINFLNKKVNPCYIFL
jgi:peptidoglycan/LPS O-acetylase OafA/YrhL